MLTLYAKAPKGADIPGSDVSLALAVNATLDL